jgi:hypothetical protein
MKNISGEKLLILERRYKQATLVSVVLIGFVIVLGASLSLAQITPIGLARQTVDALWVGVIFLAGGALLVRRVRNRWDFIKDTFTLKGLDGTMCRLRNDVVITMLFGVGATVLGVVIFLSDGVRFDLLRAILASVVVMAVSFPRKNIWKRIASELEAV